MASKFGKWLTAGCTAAVLSFGAATPALAIKYVGVFDPIFDGSINAAYDGNYGFRGEATFDVADICLTGQTGAHLVNNGEFFETSSGSGQCVIDVLAASLTIYQNVEDGIEVTHSMLAPTAPNVFGIVVKNNTLDGVVTNFFGGVQFDLDPYDYPTFSEKLFMRFFDDRVSFGPEGLEFTQTGNDPVELCAGSVGTSPRGAPLCTGKVSNPSTTTTFTQAVPEPASFGLVAVALLGVGLSRRRAGMVRQG